MSYSAFSNAANKICSNSTKEVKAMSGGSATANAASAAEIGKLVTVNNKAIAQLKDLSGPSTLVSARDTFVAQGKLSVALAVKAEMAAKAGNQADYTNALHQLSVTNNDSNPSGNMLGAPACATST